jgi:hypothetical protein
MRRTRGEARAQKRYMRMRRTWTTKTFLVRTWTTKTFLVRVVQINSLNASSSQAR